jgi:hydratase-aldolase
MRTLTSSTLRGLWAPVPTTWAESGKFDERAFRANCEKLAAAGVDGLYTTDSDGEFYAIEHDEFRKLAEVFGKVVGELQVDAAMGATWCNTAGVIERLKAACDNGIPNAHLGFPFFMPLTARDAVSFYEDIATAVPESRWIHYAHPSLQPTLTGHEYSKLQEKFPEQFIGTKLAPAGIRELTEILVNSPDLAHFVVDPNLVTGYLLGARGCYSFFVTVLPRWQRAWVDACKDGRWEEAAARHKKLMAWEVNHTQKLSTRGFRHGIIGKARASLSGILQDSGLSRAPYYPAPAELLQELRPAFDEYWAEEIAEEKKYWAQA